MNSQLAITTVESVVVAKSKTQIEADLTAFGQGVTVVGSRMTEDGYELVLEGSLVKITELIYLWNHQPEWEVNSPCE